ncbi:MAG: FadR family transcriptional regulator [Actinobacteria bacterium]|nr:FadR family transcriptional regulator [Actinomycetota bacterium]
MDRNVLAPTQGAGGRETSRAERVADDLEALARTVPAGTRLGTKESVRESAGVSVGTMNEALRLAQSRGAVVLRPGPGGGVFAAEPAPRVRLGSTVLSLDGEHADVGEAIRIRNALDPLLVEDALWHASPADIAEMREHVDAMRAATAEGDGKAFLLANWALHARIADASPHPVLRTMYRALLDLIEAHTVSVAGQTESDDDLRAYLRARADLHHDLVEALSERDGDRAARLIARHNTDAHE